MIIAYVPFIVAVVGVLMYALCKDKIAEIGRILFWTGVLVTLLTTAHHSVTL